MIVRRTLVLVAALGVLAACSDKDKVVEKPAELVELNATLPVKKLWSTSVGGGGEKLQLALGLAENSGVLYAAARDGKVRAIDEATGRTRWDADTDAELSAGPSAGDGLVVVGTTGGAVIALEADTGKQRWRAKVSGEVLAAPLVAGDRVIVRSVEGRLRALNAADGKEAWMVEDIVPRLTLRGTSPPVRAGETVLCGFDSGRVMAVGRANGDILWQAQVSSPRGRTELERLADIDAAVRVAGEEVYAVGYQGRIAMIALDGGQLWWARDLSSYSGLGIDDTQLYVATSDGDVVALRRRDGGTVWQQTGLKRRALGTPAVHLGAIVVGDFDGYLHWMDRDSGRFVARERPGDARIAAAPVAVGDRLFVIDEGGKVVAYAGGGGAGR
jgi:outer membrane protein assembly factor BamB